MKSLLAECDRDRLIEAMLPDVAFDGWSHAAVRVAARQTGIAQDEAEALFPRGSPDLVAGFSRWADRRMLDWFEAAPAARLIYETVDGIWYAAGDTATDFSFYTKRAILAGIYSAALLYWLDDRSEDFSETRAFIDRRLGDLKRFGEARQRIEDALGRLPNPWRL